MIAQPHVLTEHGTTTCPVERVRADVDDGECSACGATVPNAGDALRETLWRALIDRSPSGALWIHTEDLHPLANHLAAALEASAMTIETEAGR
jgi:hypothetical protein